MLAAAVAGPLVVVGALLGAMRLNDRMTTFHVEAREDGWDRGLATWRTVEAGQLSPAELMAEMDARMRDRPQVVVVGNSYAGTIDPRILARELGLPPKEVVVLSIPYSVGAHWRGVIEYGIVGKGYRPRLVLVQAALSNALMEAQTPKPGPWNDLWVSRSRLQRTILSSIRDVPVSWLFPVQPDGKKTQAHRAVNHVLDISKMDSTLHGRSVPISDGNPADGSTLVNPEGHIEVEDSDIPRMVELCRDHGIQFAMVAPPVLPGVGALGDEVLPERRQRIQEVVEAGGGIFVDFRYVPMSETDFFSKMNHATEEGSARFVPLLAKTLLREGALGDDVGGEVLPPVRPLTSTLAADGVVPAGGTARWSFPAWAHPPDRFEVHLLATAKGVLPTVTLGERPLEPIGQPLPDGEVFDAGTRQAPAGPWTLEVRAADAAVQVLGLTVGLGAGATTVVGSRPEVRGSVVDLLDGGRLVGRTFEAWYPPTTFASPPPELPFATFDPDGPNGVFTVPLLRAVSDSATLQLTPRPTRCSPVRVLENGVPLKGHNVARNEVRDSRFGRVAHVNQQIDFASSDRTPPYANGRSYELALDPARACNGALWLYAGDDVTVTVSPEVAAQFHRPLRELRVAFAPATPGVGPLRLRVEVDGQVRGSLDLTPEDLRAGTTVLPLEPPILPTAAIQVRLENPGRGYVLWTRAELAEFAGDGEPTWSWVP